MIVAGVATVAGTGRQIDRFRDRVVFPIIHSGEVLGFVGRRHPTAPVRTAADRNTSNLPTLRSSTRALNCGAIEQHLSAGGVPVIVEGPMDASAATLASSGRNVGVAPLGTSLTDEQAGQLAFYGKNPIVATDADLAGRVAAERDLWILTPHRLDPPVCAAARGQ
jgi:DNA primase